MINCGSLTVRTGHGTTDWFQIGKGVRLLGFEIAELEFHHLHFVVCSNAS